MARLKLKACGFSMEAEGREKFVARERKAFSDMVTGSVGGVLADLFGGPQDMNTTGQKEPEAAEMDFAPKDEEIPM